VHDIGFYNLSNTKGWPALTGTARLPLVNMRSNYTFEYLSGPSRTPVATSNAVTFADNNEPTQLHLGLCGAPGCMTITWVRRMAIVGRYMVPIGRLTCYTVLGRRQGGAGGMSFVMRNADVSCMCPSLSLLPTGDR